MPVYQFQHQRKTQYYNAPILLVKQMYSLSLALTTHFCQLRRHMRIVLDAMGSDNHPAPEVEAAVEYARLYSETLYLVGDEPRLRQLLGSRTQGIELVHAPDVFEMTDHISHGSLRKMQNSMGVGMDLIK
mgnify:CR=1 FL=1